MKKRNTDSKKEGASRTAAIGQLLGKAAEGMRIGSQKSIEGVRQGVTELGDRLKTSSASQHVGAAVESWRLLKRAADARSRGNHAMAYRLLEPLVQEDPTETKAVEAFWHAALACERVDDAVPFMTAAIRQLAASGKVERATECFRELHEAAPSARVDPSALVRIAEHLERISAEEMLVVVLRETTAVDPASLSAGLAVRIAEMAAAVDPPTALCALRRALETPDLHQAKRARLEELETQLAGGAPAAPPHTPAVDPARREAEQSVSALLEQEDSQPRFTGVKLREAMPSALLEDAIKLQVPGGRSARIEYATVEAIAVGEILGLAAYPVVLVDLLLNWHGEQDANLRVVRLRSDGFDARMLVEAPEDPEAALPYFLKDLISRCNAVLLPVSETPEASAPPRFPDLETYMRAVLQVAREIPGEESAHSCLVPEF